MHFFSITICEDWASENAMAMFSMIDGRDKLFERHVCVMRDDNLKLDFFQTGPVQPFEDVAAYNRRFLNERLTKELLVSYCMQHGVDPIHELRHWQQRSGLVFMKSS